MADVPAFVFGTQYYRPPNPPRVDWARDLARIRETGLNTVKFWACWSWMHRAPGVVDFDELDELIDLAAQNDLAVVINTILENAPYWLERQAPDTRYVAHDGQAIQLTAAINTPGGGWPGLCFDNQVARETATEFLAAVVERYHRHPALAVWDVWNEPHLEPTWYHRDKLFCYCEASRQAFRAWLQRKYSSLDELNKMWARHYSDWVEIEPPRVLETYPDLIDWREFWLENLRAWLEWRAEIVRGLDSEHPVMTHVASSAYQGTLAANGWDEWLLSAPVDLFGTSSFPRWLMNDDPVIHSFHLEMTRDAAAGKPFWQAELQGGRGRREGALSTSHPEPVQISMWIWSAIAAGAKGVLFWQWRPELLGPESPGYGLCTPSGELTERTAVVGELARLLEEVPELATSRPLPPEVGILVSRKTALLTLAADHSMDIYARALLGAYRAFSDFEVPIRFVHEDEVAEATDLGLEALYWPMPLLATRSVARGVQAFVERGGALVAEAAPGHYVDGGWSSPLIPSSGLAELFGVEEIDSDAATEAQIALGDRVIKGDWFVERLRPTTAEVVGHFDDGSAAITRNHTGRGHAILVATFPSLAYERTRDPSTGQWIASVGGACISGVKTALCTRVQEAGDALVVFALNQSPERFQGTVPLPQGITEVRHAVGAIRPADGRLEVRLDSLEAAIAVLAKEVPAITDTS